VDLNIRDPDYLCLDPSYSGSGSAVLDLAAPLPVVESPHVHNDIWPV